MGLTNKKTVLATWAMLVVFATICQADFGAQDLMRQARAFRQQQQQQPQQQRRPQQQQRLLRPAAGSQRRSEQPLLKRSNENNKFDNFGLSEAELNGGSYRPAPGAFSGYRDPERDGARYDNHGNRIKHANAGHYAADRRSEQQNNFNSQEEVEDVPRQQYRYPKPERRLEREPEVRPEIRINQNAPKRLPVNLEPKIEEIRQTVAIPEKAIDVLKSRSDDVYAPASGPAFADSAVAGSDSVPLEQRDIEAAVVSGANAFGIPTGAVYQTEDRLSFQIHGQDGPHSYKYGYDTGNGYNRQFRYEERNGAGYVKGRYGFFDQLGKLQVVNYSADPELGFHAEGAGVPEYPH